MVADALRWTTRDLDAMPDDGGWKRYEYEIVDGELFVTRAPHIRHQGAAGKLHVRLGTWSEMTARGECLPDPRRYFQPY